MQAVLIRNNYYSFKSMHDAIVYLETVESIENVLKTSNLDINERDNCEYTPLIQSIFHFDKPEISMFLIDKGADVKACNINHQTALHIAVRRGVDVAEKLILNGANINAADKYGTTPLHEAVCAGNFKAVKLLLKYGANPNAVTDLLMTPFMMAVEKNVDINIQKLLLQHTADVHNARNYDGCNSLLLALQGGSEIAIDLLEYGEGVNQLVAGKNALDFALKFDCFIPHFKKFVAKCNYDIFVASGCDPILFTLLGIRLDAQLWCEIFELLLYSSQSQKIVLHCAALYQCAFLSVIIQEFYNRKIPEDKLVSILEICLMHGVEIYLNNLELALECYGINQIFKMFARHNVIIKRVNYPTLALLVADTQKSPSHYLKNCSFHFNKSLLKSQLRHINLLLKYCTPPKSLQQKLYKYYLNVFEIQRDVDEQLAYDAEKVIEKMNSMQVPSLKEISRDVCRTFISSYFGGGLSVFYSVMKAANIPEVVKQILLFERQVNNICLQCI